MDEVNRIIRVDHAGEYGAIHIYQAQIFVSRYLYQDIVPILEEMLEHEKQHFKTFNQLLHNRKIRHCYALRLWALGGIVLGFTTGYLGRNAIWTCTNAVESTVLHHLEWQLNYLSTHDVEVYKAVSSIQSDEIEHQHIGATRSSNSLIYKPIFWVVSQSTRFAIWLSTKL